MRIVLALLTMAMLAGCQQKQPAGGGDRPNSVARFLDGAEVQAETDAQRSQIRRALTDMLEKPASELRNTRYADYQGKPGEWDLPKLLTSHFVPNERQALDPEQLYADVEKPEAKAAVRKVLDSMTAAAAP